MRLALGVVGAVIGAYLGGPVGAFQGFSIGYGVGGLLGPNQKVQGPKLDDLKRPSASYGSPIPYVEGAPRLTGCIFWASDKREIAHEQSQSKGGPGVDATTFTYEIDVMVGVASNPCQAVTRAWSNGKLVWSASDLSDDQTFVASGGISVDGNFIASSTEIIVSGSTPVWRALRFYGGGPNQMPDPTYEAAVGIGNAPAYRGRSTVFIEGLNLGGNGQLPVITFEVVSLAELDIAAAELTRVANQRDYAAGIPAMSLSGFYLLVCPTVTTTVNVYRIGSNGVAQFVSSFDTPGTSPTTAAHGNSDVSCLYASESATLKYWRAYKDGSATLFDCTSYGTSPARQFGRISQLGNDVVIGCATGALNLCIARFDAVAGGDPVVVSAPMAQGQDAVAIGGANVYALTGDNASIYVLDLATLMLQSTITTPVVSSNTGSIVCDADGTLYFSTQNGTPALGGAVWRWNGAAWVLLFSGIGTTAGAGDTGSFSFVDGTFFSQDFLDSTTDFQVVRYTRSSITIVPPTLAEVVSRLCLRTGQLTADDIDVTDLESGVPIADGLVNAMAVSQVGPTRTTLEMLMGAYLFECVEGEKLRFVKRGAAAAMTIPYADLGASQDGNAEPLPKKRLNDIEIPALVTVKYANILNDFQDGAESGDRLVTDSTAVAVVEVPLGLAPTDAKKLADANTMDLAVSLLQIGPIALPRRYAALEPTDVLLLIAADGSIFRARIVKATISGGINAFDLVLDDATVVNSETSTDDDYSASYLVRLLAATNLQLLDIPILRDADDTPGFYAAFGADGVWTGAELDVSSDDVTFTKVLTAIDRAVVGTANSVLGDFTGGVVFDERNFLTVDVGDSVLSSTTRDAMLESTINALLVGAEIVQFRTAALLSPGIYQLSGLLRGRRGTEWATSGHVAGESVVLLQASGLRRVQDQQADIGISRYWKAVTFSTSSASVTAQTFTDTAVGLKPFSPVDLRAVKDASGNIVVTWKRRTRLSTSFCGAAGISVPLGETVESYSIDIVNTGTGLTVRTLAASLPTCTYATNQQATDGISSASNILFRVYQLSSSVGRGYPSSVGAVGGRSPQAEIATITVGGVFSAGVPLYAIVGASTVNYTTTAGDTNLNGVAASLGALIDALAVYIASVAGPVITITAPVSTPFALQAGLVGSAQFPTSVVQAAAAAAVGSSKKVEVTLQGTFPVATGTYFRLRLERGVPGYGDKVLTYEWTSTASQPASAILGNLAAAVPTVSGGAAAITWLTTAYGAIDAVFPVGETQWTVSGYAADAGVNFVISTVDTGATSYAADQAQVVDMIIPGSGSGAPTAGTVFRVTLAGVNFDYVAVGGDSYASVLAALIAAVTGATYTASDASAFVGSYLKAIRVAANVANVPFTYVGWVLPGQITLAAAITQQAI